MDSSEKPARDVFRVGVTGHRLLNDPSAIARRCREVLMRVQHEHATLLACSALAIGADTLFAEAALDIGIPFEAILPFEHYVVDFDNADARRQYEHLLMRATHVIVLPHSERSDEAYRDAGIWLVEHCQMLVAIWDGHRTEREGGTSEIVSFAERQRLAVWWVHAERAEERYL